jgi:hypothetical protein
MKDSGDKLSNMAMSFESSLKNIQVVSGFLPHEMEVLKGKLLEIGFEAVAGPLAVAEAYNDVVGGITNAASYMGVLNASIALAKAGQADLGTAANSLVKVMNSYGFSALDTAGATQKAAFVADVFSQTVGMGVGSMDAFVASMAPIHCFFCGSRI